MFEHTLDRPKDSIGADPRNSRDSEFVVRRQLAVAVGVRLAQTEDSDLAIVVVGSMVTVASLASTMSLTMLIRMMALVVVPNSRYLR